MSVLVAFTGSALVALVVAWLLGLRIFQRPLGQAQEDEVELAVRRIERAPDPGRFSPTTVTAAVAAFLVVGFISGLVTRSVIIAFAVGCLGGAIPLIVEARQQAKRRTERIEAWPEAIRQLISSLRAPMSVHASLLDLAKTGPSPLRPAFETYTVLSRRLDSQQALEMVRRDLADPVSDRIIEVLILSLEQGAAVTLDVLNELASSVTEDLRLNETIRTMMLDVRIDAAAIGIIPFALLIATVIGIDEWRDFYSTAGGQIIILLALMWSAFGVSMILFVIRVRPEPRILHQESAA